MAEALIVRKGGLSETILPIIPGSHTILATLRDYTGKKVSGYPLNCKDGSRWYNYSTNENGQVLFTCNSGSANISLINGQYVDFSTKIINIDAPVGLSSKVNISMDKISSILIANNRLFKFFYPHKCNIRIIGGGGGGGAGWSRTDDDGWKDYMWGQNGGNGYISIYNSQSFTANTIYNFIAGNPGTRAYPYWHSSGDGKWMVQASTAGGTSYIVGSSYKANGGSNGYSTYWGDGYSDHSSYLGRPANGGTSTLNGYGAGGLGDVGGVHSNSTSGVIGAIEINLIN